MGIVCELVTILYDSMVVDIFFEFFSFYQSFSPDIQHERAGWIPEHAGDLVDPNIA